MRPSGTHPRFAWRGLLIDPARHFWTLEELKQYVDYLAIHKLNRLQIHFTDHENWTVEVNRYPNLTPEKQRNAADSSRETNQTYQNLARHYYTHDELRSLLAFAAKRFVTIVPEFEMPGHCGGLLRGCPECGCTVDSQKAGGGEVCPGQEKTYEILQNILDEMLEIFPGQYIHIGADECGKENWKKCADCQARMRDEGLQGVTELHGYFVSRMSDYLRAKGRTLVGWDEILESGAKPGADRNVLAFWSSRRIGAQGRRPRTISGDDTDGPLLLRLLAVHRERKRATGLWRCGDHTPACPRAATAA